MAADPTHATTLKQLKQVQQDADSALEKVSKREQKAKTDLDTAQEKVGEAEKKVTAILDSIAQTEQRLAKAKASFAKQLGPGNEEAAEPLFKLVFVRIRIKYDIFFLFVFVFVCFGIGEREI